MLSRCFVSIQVLASAGELYQLAHRNDSARASMPHAEMLMLLQQICSSSRYHPAMSATITEVECFCCSS